MCVGGPTQMLEVLEGVPDNSFVQRAKVRARMAEWITACEVPEVPVNKLPIETVVVANEKCATFGVLVRPAGEVLHHAFRIVKAQSIFTREPTDGQSVGYPIIGNWLQPAIEDVLQPCPHKYGAKADHAVVAGDGAVRFYVHHYIGHLGCLRCMLIFTFARLIARAGAVFQGGATAIRGTAALALRRPLRES